MKLGLVRLLIARAEQEQSAAAVVEPSTNYADSVLICVICGSGVFRDLIILTPQTLQLTRDHHADRNDYNQHHTVRRRGA